MAQESIQIADKPTLDQVKELVENFKFMNIIECSFDSDKITIEPEKLTDILYDFYHACAVVLNDEIHILGGYDSSTSKNHYKWDGSSWVQVSTLPYEFKEGCAVVLNNEIHIMGGDGSGYTKHYKWDGSSWTSVSTLPYWMYGGSTTVLNGEIHMLGSAYSSHNKKHYKWDGSSWTEVSTLPVEFYAGCAIVFNGEINILGPKGSTKAHYKWDGSSWVSVSTLPYVAGFSSTVVYNGKLHIFGSNYTKYMNVHYEWDGSSWLSSGTLPINFYSGSVVVCKNGIHLMGGLGEKTAHYVIREGQGKKIIVGLPKGTKILTQYSIDDMYGFTNCVKDGDYLVVTKNGVVEFLIDTEAESAKLTLMY